MKTLETERLILRKFTPDDFTAVHTYASDLEVATYMVWGPNSEAETRGFLNMAIRSAEAERIKDYQYAATLKDTGELIGGCNLHLGDEEEVGWILNPVHQGKGYGYEMGKRLLQFGFEELNLHRIVAFCDAENVASYRLMEKLGMRREGHRFDTRYPNKKTDRDFSDEFIYAMLKSEWEVAREIDYYNALPFEFNGFIDIPTLSNGDIYLVCTEKSPAQPEKNYVPAYNFAVCKGSEKIGDVNLRIGYMGGINNKDLYHCGQIGYVIDEKHRGNDYAVEACKLLLPIARAHKMQKLLITNNVTNVASRRVCEKIGAKHLRCVRLPEYSDLYLRGQRFINIFELEV